MESFVQNEPVMNDGKGIEKGHASRRPGPEQRPGPEDVLSEFGESWQELQDCDGTDGWADQDTVKLALLAAAKPKRGVAALSIGALLAVFGAAGLTWFNIGTDSAPSPRAPEVPRP